MHQITYLLKSWSLKTFILVLIILIVVIMNHNALKSSLAYSSNAALLQDSKQILKPSHIDIRAVLTTNTKVANPDQDITYTFTFKNIGTEVVNNLIIQFDAPNAMFSEPLKGNFTRFKRYDFETSKVKRGPISEVPDGSKLLQTIIWQVDEFALLDSQAIRFTLTVDALKESKTLIAFMTLRCAPNFVKTYSAEVEVELLPELTISKSVSPIGKYLPGDFGTYILNFSNNGDRDIDSVVIKDVLPPDLIYMGASQAPDEILNRNYTWIVVLLKAKEQGSIRISFQVDPNFQASVPDSIEIRNSVTIKSGPFEDAASVSFKIIIPEIQVRVSRTSETIYPATEKSVTITLFESIKIWAGWPVFLKNFTISIVPPNAQLIPFSVANMPVFPVAPDTMSFVPNYRPPKKFTDAEIEKWDVRFDYLDQLGQQDFVTTSFYVEARNDLVLDRNVSRSGEPVQATIFIAKENRVKIDIYNEIGEHVRQLINSYYPSDSNATTVGENVPPWNCDSNDGRMVGSGIYIFVMQAGGYKTFKKVVVVH